MCNLDGVLRKRSSKPLKEYPSKSMSILHLGETAISVTGAAKLDSSLKLHKRCDRY
jgi:hypothetical protein